LDFTTEEYLEFEKSYFYFFKCFFKSRGIPYKDGYFIINNGEIDIQCRGGIIGVKYIYLNNNKQLEQVFLNRYVLYPKIINFVTGSTYIPTPSWGYGFIETMISTFDKFLLNDIVNHCGIFNEIIKENQIYLNKMRIEPLIIFTNEIIQKEKNKMLEIQFEPKTLSLELYKKRENPFKIKR
jgi:hypothetical protein